MTAWSTWRARSFSSVCTIRSRYPDTKQYQNFERGDEIASLCPREVVKPPRGPRIVGRAAAEGEASNLGDKRKRPARGVRGGTLRAGDDRERSMAKQIDPVPLDE